jgi:hypothetical protein
MFIQTLLPPVAGEVFRFSVAGGAGATTIEVFVNKELILDQQCTELPCRTLAEIPPSTGGETLRISATDSAGSNKTVEYQISDSDPGPHSMLAGT